MPGLPKRWRAYREGVRGEPMGLSFLRVLHDVLERSGEETAAHLFVLRTDARWRWSIAAIG